MIGKIRNTVDLSKLSDEQLISHYLGIDEIPILINSPFRKDKNPSFSIYYSNNCVRWMDFATGEKGSVFDLLMRVFDLDYKGIINKISDEYNILNEKGVFQQKTVERKNKKKTIKVSTRNWKKHDIVFWNSFGVNKDFLLKSDTFPISRISVEYENRSYEFAADKYAYAYIDRKENSYTLKIYQPFSDKYKWLSSHDKSVIDLWHLLPDNGEKLIITSSKKDAMAIWCQLDIPSISLQSEGHFLNEDVLNELKSRFNDIYILFDNDFNSIMNYGQIYANKLCSLYNLKNIFIPTILQSKDPSDLYFNHNKDIFSKTILNLLN